MRHLALKTVMMPRDTNPYGTIFGGVILSYVDQAGAVGARHELQDRGLPPHTLVTVGMKSVEFHEPVYVGDTVSFLTSCTRLGRTSITIDVLVETEREGQILKLTEAEVTYVAIDTKDGRRRPVPIQPRDG